MASGDREDAGRLDLTRAVAKLPDRHREVIVLHYLCDLSVDDVAQELGVPSGTVKSRLSRARDELARLMEDEVLDDA